MGKRYVSASERRQRGALGTNGVNMPAPSTLDTDGVRLPDAYVWARAALAKCAKLDECKDWADKAEAIASYARQAEDDSLRKTADRIQARAVRRCGELLKQIPADKGGYAQNYDAQEGAHPSMTRTQAAEDAGLSEHQRKTALRVASVPEDEFERDIESESPPTVTELAERGKQSKPIDFGGLSVTDRDKAEQGASVMRKFASFCSVNEPAYIAGLYGREELAMLQGYATRVGSWLGQFVTCLGTSTKAA